MGPIRNLAVGASIAGIVTTLCLAAPANAAVLSSGTLNLSGSASTGGSCTFSTAPTPITADYTDGQSVTRSYSYTQTATGTDPTDVVTFTGSEKETIRSTVSNGDLTSLSLTGTSRASISAAKGSASTCFTGTSTPLSASAGIQTSPSFTRTKAAWMHIQVTATGTGAREGGVLLMPDTSGAISSGSYDISLSTRDISRSEWLYITPGTYGLQMLSASVASEASGLQTASSTSTVKLSFVSPGSAVAGETGTSTARSMVTMPSGLTCSTAKAAVRLTSKIKGASSVSLYVNGSRKASLNRPTSKTVAVAVPRTTAVNLEAVVKKSGKSYTIARSYHSC